MKTIAMPWLAQLAHHAEELFGLVRVEARRRLVEDEDPRRRDVKRPADRRHLLDRDRIGAQGLRHVDLDVEVVEDPGGPAVHRPPIDPTPAPRRAPDQDVLGHRKVRAEIDLLVDGADPDGLGVLGGSDVDVLPVEGDGAGIRPLDAGQDLDQRGLAGAVLADEGVDLAWCQVEVHALEGLHAGEGFLDAAHGQEEASL